MVDQVLKVRIVGTDDGFKAVVDSSASSIERIEQGARKFGDTLGNLRGIVAGLGVTLSAGYFAHMIKGTIDASDELSKMAQKTATTVAGLSALQYAAQLSGLDNEQLATGLEKLNKSMNDAALSTSVQAHSFNALGIETRNAAGQLRPTEQVLLDLADAFSKSHDKGATAALAMNILGKSGAELIPLLNGGRQGITALMNEARQLGIVIDTETAEASERFNDNLSRMSAKVHALSVTMVNELAPDLSDITDAMVEAAKQSGILTAAWVGLGGVANLVVNGSQVSQINKQIDDLKAQRDFIRGGLESGKRPVPFFEWLGLDVKLNDQALATGAGRLRDVEQQLQALIKTRDDLLNPKKSSAAGGGDDLAAAYACYTQGGVWDSKARKCLNASGSPIESAEAYGKRMADLARQAYPEATQSAEQYGEVQKQEALNWLANQESAEAYGKRMADLARQGYPEATQSAEEYGQAQADIAKKMLAAAQASDQTVQIYKDTATSIRGAFRNTFLDIENNGIKSFKSLGPRLLDIMKSILADMATLAIARPIILPVVSGIGGLLGVSGQAQASVLQQLGINPLTVGAGAGSAGLLSYLGTFGTGISAGLQGGFGAASQLGGLGATTFGAYTGAALPWIGGALAYYAAANALSGGSTKNRNLGLLTGLGTEALNKVSGGFLFGNSSHISDTGLQLDLSGGTVSGQAFTQTSSRKPLRRHGSTSVSYSAADADLLGGINASLDAGMQSIIAGAGGLGVSAAQNILDGFAQTTQLSLQGKSQQEVQKAIQDWLDKTLGDMAKSVLQDTRYAGLVKNASKDMLDALLSLGKTLSANPITDAAEQMRLAGRSLLQQYDDQRAAVTALAQAYDGSTTSTQDLAAATQSAYTLSLQLIQQIASVRDSIGTSIGSSIENIQTSVMTPDQLYSYYTGKAQGLAGQLNTATDPAVIETLVSEIEKYTNSAYGTVPASAQPGVADQFVKFLQGVQDTAGTRLDLAQGSAGQTYQDLSKTIQDSMATVAARMDAAAQAQIDAANAAKAAMQALTDTAHTVFSFNHYNYSG